METAEAKQLLIKYHNGQCTEAEKALVENSFLHFNEHEIDITPERIIMVGKEIYHELPITNAPKRINLWRGVAAIAAMMVLTMGTWHLFDRFSRPSSEVIVQDVNPGGNKAILTLANGKTLNLSSAKRGIINDGEKLTYEDGTLISDMPSSTHILSTPNGGQYQIVLADGTKVWLNAASKLTYPTSFANAATREVTLTGEAYFEVAHNPAQPFLIKTNFQTVQVLGTHFNINSYEDNGATVTTLAEGAVSVNNSAEKAVLKPGQQSLVTAKSIRVQAADLETDLAWKNGKMEFKEATIHTIMAQVARWYDIDIEYQGELSNRLFNGSISRDSNLSVLLKILAYSDIHFTISQDKNSRKKLIVKP
jgi:transmembrane sensor